MKNIKTIFFTAALCISSNLLSANPISFLVKNDTGNTIKVKVVQEGSMTYLDITPETFQLISKLKPNGRIYIQDLLEVHYKRIKEQFPDGITVTNGAGTELVLKRYQ